MAAVIEVQVPPMTQTRCDINSCAEGTYAQQYQRQKLGSPSHVLPSTELVYYAAFFQVIILGESGCSGDLEFCACLSTQCELHTEH